MSRSSETTSPPGDYDDADDYAGACGGSSDDLYDEDDDDEDEDEDSPEGGGGSSSTSRSRRRKRGPEAATSRAAASDWMALRAEADAALRAATAATGAPDSDGGGYGDTADDDDDGYYENPATAAEDCCPTRRDGDEVATTRGREASKEGDVDVAGDGEGDGEEGGGPAAGLGLLQLQSRDYAKRRRVSSDAGGKALPAAKREAQGEGEDTTVLAAGGVDAKVTKVKEEEKGGEGAKPTTDNKPLPALQTPPPSQLHSDTTIAESGDPPVVQPILPKEEPKDCATGIPTTTIINPAILKAEPHNCDMDVDNNTRTTTTTCTSSSASTATTNTSMISENDALHDALEKALHSATPSHHKFRPYSCENCKWCLQFKHSTTTEDCKTCGCALVYHIQPANSDDDSDGDDEDDGDGPEDDDDSYDYTAFSDSDKASGASSEES
ncbi:hypothetical protein Pelo_4858 [Pelomyxa schiedti]|nr:hypothetical protein Pelo_4858 [Pelomyxa schiedti]